MSVSVDQKPERAVQAKIRDKQKFTIILIGWNPKRAIYAKDKDHDKVTTSVRHDPLGASSDQKTSNLTCLQDSKQGQFKVVRENNGYCVPSPYIYHFPKLLKNPWSHAIRRLPPNSSNLSLCQFIWNSHLFYIQDFFYFFFMAILEAKIFKIQFFFFHIFWKVWTTNTHSLNSWVVGSVHPHPPRER